MTEREAQEILAQLTTLEKIALLAKWEALIAQQEAVDDYLANGGA